MTYLQDQDLKDLNPCYWQVGVDWRDVRMRGVASEIRPRLSGRCRLKGIDDRRALISSLFGRCFESV